MNRYSEIKIYKKGPSILNLKEETISNLDIAQKDLVIPHPGQGIPKKNIVGHSVKLLIGVFM